MVKLEINDKKYKIPESFEELSLDQYCKVFYKLDTDKTDDELMDFKRSRQNESIILSRLLGENDDFCLDLPLNVYAQLNEKVRFLYDVDYLLKNAKAGIVIDGKRYSIPPFNEMSLRQYIDADVVMKEKENDLQYIELLSILLTAKDKEGKWIPYDGKYEELMGKIRQLKCSEALPLVYHFFKKGEALKRISKVSMKVEASQQHQLTASS
jgi:hypothetical protein